MSLSTSDPSVGTDSWYGADSTSEKTTDASKPTNVTVNYKKHRLSALIDTGSDITIANADSAQKYRWMVHPSRLKEVKAANNEVSIIVGKAKEYMTVGDRTEAITIYLSPDVNGLILGLDLLHLHGRIEWNFTDRTIQLGNNGWLKLHDDAKSRCPRILC